MADRIGPCIFPQPCHVNVAHACAPLELQRIVVEQVGTQGASLLGQWVVRGNRAGIAPMAVKRMAFACNRRAAHLKQTGADILR